MSFIISVNSHKQKILPLGDNSALLTTTQQQQTKSYCHKYKYKTWFWKRSYHWLSYRELTTEQMGSIYRVLILIHSPRAKR